MCDSMYYIYIYSMYVLYMCMLAQLKIWCNYFIGLHVGQ